MLAGKKLRRLDMPANVFSGCSNDASRHMFRLPKQILVLHIQPTCSQSYRQILCVVFCTFVSKVVLIWLCYNQLFVYALDAAKNKSNATVFVVIIVVFLYGTIISLSCFNGDIQSQHFPVQICFQIFSENLGKFGKI